MVHTYVPIRGYWYIQYVPIRGYWYIQYVPISHIKIYLLYEGTYKVKHRVHVKKNTLQKDVHGIVSDFRPGWPNIEYKAMPLKIGITMGLISHHV